MGGVRATAGRGMCRRPSAPRTPSHVPRLAHPASLPERAGGRGRVNHDHPARRDSANNNTDIPAGVVRGIVVGPLDPPPAPRFFAATVEEVHHGLDEEAGLAALHG